MVIDDGVNRGSTCAARCKNLGLLTVDGAFDGVIEVDVVGSTLLIADVGEFVMNWADQCLIGSGTKTVSKEAERCNADHHATRWQRLLCLGQGRDPGSEELRCTTVLRWRRPGFREVLPRRERELSYASAGRGAPRG